MESESKPRPPADDKEAVKAQIRALCDKIRKAGPSSIEWAPHEWDIAKLIVDYSIRHDIVIPLVDYERYKRRDAVAENIEKLKNEKPVFGRRRKVDEPGEETEEPYQCFDDFVEAAGESYSKNPRFTLHPDIAELVACWDQTLDRPEE